MKDWEIGDDGEDGLRGDDTKEAVETARGAVGRSGGLLLEERSGSETAGRSRASSTWGPNLGLGLAGSL